MAGFTVIRCPVYRAAWHTNSKYQPPVINLDHARVRPRYGDIWQVYDMTNGEVLANDVSCFAVFEQFVERAQPDILMLEHPWLWPAVKKLSASSTTNVIYNSHNLEADLKCRILKEAGNPEADTIALQIEGLERELVSASIAVSATTDADAAVYREWTTCPVVVAPNGGKRRPRARLRGIVPDPVKPWWRYLLFVASAHPPNAAGFIELAMKALAHIGSEHRIVVAGTVCSMIAEHLRKAAGSIAGSDRLVLLGEVSSTSLDCLIENAAGMLLPITYGAGSNLKTAEALLAGHPIVGTTKAFRGNERFTTLPGILVADTQKAFCVAMQNVLSGQTPSPDPDKVVDALTWDHTLRPIVDLVRATSKRQRPEFGEEEPGQTFAEGAHKSSIQIHLIGDEQHPSNDDFLAIVTPWSGRAPRGYIPTFTGAMVAAPFWAHWLSDSRLAEVLSDGPRSETTRRPTFGDGEYYFEQANIIRSVVCAGDNYVMVELGGGNGPRAVDAALVLRTLKPHIRPFLVVVEALPTYVHWCLHHFAANGLDADDHWIINAIVSADPSPELFFLQPRGFGNQMADSSVTEMLSSLIMDKSSALNLIHRLSGGGVSLRNGSLADAPARDPIDLGAAETWTVESVRQAAVMPPGSGAIGFVSAVRLADILAPLPQVDFMDVDIQHAEIHVIPPSLGLLRRKVRLLSIGTHTIEIHRDLLRLFRDAGWRIINTIEPYGHHIRDAEAFHNNDGVLTVQNPEL
jgi:hypothetical protein